MSVADQPLIQIRIAFLTIDTIFIGGADMLKQIILVLIAVLFLIDPVYAQKTSAEGSGAAGMTDKQIADKYKVPITATGFEPLDLMLGILQTVRMLENDQHQVKNAYPRAVEYKGNIHAQRIISEAFIECDRQWRGIGLIPMSGWKLRPKFQAFDAEFRFKVDHIQTKESEICISGLILQGQKKPFECPAFRKICTPHNPLGATMVSSEGACAAYYRYGKKSYECSK